MRGRVESRPCGTFQHRKLLSSGKTVACRIDVYLLLVETELAEWPERTERQRRWFALDEVAAAVDNLSLRELLRRVAEEQPFG